jgi:uncharacterized OB-fold protein
METKLKPFLDNILEPGPPASLMGGYCSSCERKYFPIPMVCPRCLNAPTAVHLSGDGTLYSFTVVRTKAPLGLPTPYAIGYVDLEADNLRVIALLDTAKMDELKIGQPVTLKVAPLGVDGRGEACLRYYFTPRTEGGRS